MSIGSKNATSETGVPQPFVSFIKYGDGIARWKRIDCSTNGYTSTSLHMERMMYLYNVVSAECFSLIMPVFPTRHDWFVEGAVFLRQDVVNSVLVNVWDKEDHLYIETVAEPVRILRVTTPTDQNGDVGQEDTALYIPLAEFPQGVFDIPAFCGNATVTTFAELEVRHQLLANTTEPDYFYDCFGASNPNGRIYF
eukprot:TRINITY_DN833_c0_g1_i1.p1 TRINITY_DN833_c0_g1~~TRINITY_DN833_c0_g1_i1.p1  ORF type:complete len:229 (-),score=67.48 TRINITY_DN833_c0_g1_i1:31-615(-)